MEGWDKGKFAQEVGKERCFHGAILVPRASVSFSHEVGDISRRVALGPKMYCLLLPLDLSFNSEGRLLSSIDPLHKWRLNLNNNTWYILSLTFM